MHNRKAKVQIKQHLSKKRTLRQGVPQGGVLSPTLFLIFIRDILHRMPKNMQGAIYVDDLALWCSEEYITTANYRLQQALQVIESWARSWLVKANEKKTTFMIFSLSNQKHSVHLKLNGQTLHQEDTPTYLGVTLDRRLTWKNKKLQKNQARAKIWLALMKKLSCTEWGADQNVLKKLYVGRIHPVLEYGMAASSTAAKSNSCKLSRVQHQAMRMMTGAMRSTPISAMETVTGLQPLEDRQEIKVLTQAAKFKRLQDHPMHERMNQSTSQQVNRLARDGGQLEQEDRYTTYTDEKTIIKTLSKKKWKQQHPNYNQSDSLHKLNGTEQVILFRLRTGHNRLNAHMYKFMVGESEMCPCNADIMTAEHLLQHCPLHDAMRRDTWPDPTLLRDKLYGNLEELRRTADFVRATGISI